MIFYIDYKFLDMICSIPTSSKQSSERDCLAILHSYVSIAVNKFQLQLTFHNPTQ